MGEDCPRIALKLFKTGKRFEKGVITFALPVMLVAALLLFTPLRDVIAPIITQVGDMA